MFKIIKLKSVIIVLLAVVAVLCSVGVVAVVESKSVPKNKYTIVIDAGHGGADGGCTGVATNVKESELNLAVAMKLGEYLKNMGMNVVYTRTGDGALVSDGKNFKVRDMEERAKIISKANPDMVISIHMNSFVAKEEDGAQMYYQQGDVKSKRLADSIQNQIKKSLPNGRDFANHGDYYILKVSDAPTVIAECGYLTNPTEEAKLIDPEYQKQVAYTLMCGIVEYLGCVG